MAVKKKIGIISYHSGYNLGTMLQAYALQRVIQEEGYPDVEYINYVEGVSFKEATLKIKVKKLFSKLRTLPGEFPVYFNKLLYRKGFQATVRAFNHFLTNRINNSHRPYHSLTQLKENPPVYDIYLVGSDQTWNPTFLKDNSAYFLSFVDDHKSKNSYAASIGVYDLEKEVRQKYVQHLKGFRAISCREAYGAELLTQLLKRPVEHVLDPTLLLSAEQWQEVEQPVDISGSYVLAYFLGSKQSSRKFARQLGEKHGIPVYFIVSSVADLKEKKKLFGIGPAEFLYLIRHASYVCTDSFHGTIFSINYNRNFYSFCKWPGDEKVFDNFRIPNVLREFHLEKRLKNESFLEEEDIDYKELNDILRVKKEQSFAFLRSILE